MSHPCSKFLYPITYMIDLGNLLTLTALKKHKNHLKLGNYIHPLYLMYLLPFIGSFKARDIMTTHSLNLLG